VNDIKTNFFYLVYYSDNSPDRHDYDDEIIYEFVNAVNYEFYIKDKNIFFTGFSFYQYKYEKEGVVELVFRVYYDSDKGSGTYNSSLFEPHNRNWEFQKLKVHIEFLLKEFQSLYKL